MLSAIASSAGSDQDTEFVCACACKFFMLAEEEGGRSRNEKL